jgi:alkylation response protein AidB-like acyl-CoA dehydrogenase
LDLAVQYAKDRMAFGVPIGTFQAIAHPLADVASAVEGARHLVWKAAWLADHEPERAPVEMEMAYLHACRTADRATKVGIHTQGGFGFTLESDMQLYFRRAKSAALLAGDPRARLAAIADLLYGPAGAN